MDPGNSRIFQVYSGSYTVIEQGQQGFWFRVLLESQRLLSPNSICHTPWHAMPWPGKGCGPTLSFEMLSMSGVGTCSWFLQAVRQHLLMVVSSNRGLKMTQIISEVLPANALHIAKWGVPWLDVVSNNYISQSSQLKCQIKSWIGIRRSMVVLYSVGMCNKSVVSCEVQSNIKQAMKSPRKGGRTRE